ncbi:MAG: hypothetical protein ABSE97_10380 [Verrucomicrobiota bacterium]
MRKWFTLGIPDHQSFRCVAILPKPLRRYPVMVFAHWNSGDLLKDGDDLRQMAELGLAAVSLEYNQTNEAVFDMQFQELLHYLDKQSWVNTNAIAWIGESRGAIYMLDFVLQHPERQPRLLVQLSGMGIQDDYYKSELGLLHCSFLFVHGERDEIFPVADTEQLASELQTNSVSTEVKVMPGLPHTLNPENGIIFRAAGEYCLTHLIGKNVWQNYRSIAQWQAKAPPLWLWWLLAAIWAGGWLIGRSCAKTQPVKTQLSRSEIGLRWLVVLLAIGALSVMALHLVTPLFAVSDTTSAIARRFLVQPKERMDFEYLVAQPIWRGQRLKTLLEHVGLSGYNRELVNWQVDDRMYRDFVLSPVITGNPDEQLNWRRSLWEEFYPCIRHETSPEDAAKIVVRHLRERVTIATAPNLPQEVPVIWLMQITDEAGFQTIYVAALRAAGVPARLGSQHQAEFWNGDKWQAAPTPSVTSW